MGQIKKISDKVGDFDNKYTRIKFNSDSTLPLNKMLRLHKLTIVVRSFSHENSNKIDKIDMIR